eukprot:7186512-Heterocapsa_arctica.AAC.1
MGTCWLRASTTPRCTTSSRCRPIDCLLPVLVPPPNSRSSCRYCLQPIAVLTCRAVVPRFGAQPSGSPH